MIRATAAATLVIDLLYVSAEFLTVGLSLQTLIIQIQFEKTAAVSHL